MATKTIIYRPSFDISTSYFEPSSGSSLYAMLNEESADADSTYVTATNTSEYNSFVVGGNFYRPSNAVVSAMAVHVVQSLYKTGSGTNEQNFTLGCATYNGEPPIGYYLTATMTTPNSSAYKHTQLATTVENAAAGLEDLDNKVSASHDKFAILVSTYGNLGTKNTFKVTQVYMEVTYEVSEPFYIKQNGAWTALGGTLYQKQNGVWVATDASVLNDANKYIIAPEIKFTAGNVEYTAINGMTWQQWVDSEYNTKGATINSSTGEIVWTKSLQIYVYTGDQLSDRRVLATEKIIENHAYHTAAVLPI